MDEMQRMSKVKSRAFCSVKITGEKYKVFKQLAWTVEQNVIFTASSRVAHFFPSTPIPRDMRPPPLLSAWEVHLQI